MSSRGRRGTPSSNGNFATMDKDDLREVAAKGGRHSSNDYREHHTTGEAKQRQRSRDSAHYSEEENHSGSEGSEDERSSSQARKYRRGSQSSGSGGRIPASMSHEGHVRTGYLAALHNPRVSKEMKEHARRELEKMPGGGKVAYEQNPQAKYSREYYRDHHDVDDQYQSEESGDEGEQDNKKYSRSKSPSYKKYGDDSSSQKKYGYRGKSGGDDRSASKYGDDRSSKQSYSRSKSPSYKKYDNDRSSSQQQQHQYKYEGSEESENDEPHHVPGHGRQGFASMPLHKIQEIASMGGRTRHAGEGPRPLQSESEESGDDSHYTRSKSPSYKKYGNDSSSSKSGKYGYRGKSGGDDRSSSRSGKYGGDDRSYSKSGKSSQQEHQYKYEGSEESENDEPHHVAGHGRQGFASMPLHKVQEIASMGGRTRHAGEAPRPRG
eukprot:TRINITY_DN323_c0_g1_i12.p1 TRINITY_DN323_c0_g1~~TRINITY_DN323_c0_g1_i12.p1  ORF type:complete len:468 (-),score=85.64 TRINITY_DN323_c0_g1_i12:353-1657(-)